VIQLFVCNCALNVVGVVAPQIIVINSSTVEIYWSKPNSTNGLLLTYRLYRSDEGMEEVLLFSESADVYSTVDSTVKPGAKYRYLLQAGNVAGASNSSWVPVTVPQQTPASVPVITEFNVSSSSTIFIAWDNSTADQYRVLIIAELREHDSEWPVNESTSRLIITGLRPYSWYSARLVSCIQGVPNGCRTGPATQRVRTWEAEPTHQRRPLLTPTGPTSVVVSWQPPQSPNGVIILYRIRRRDRVLSVQSESGILINVVNGSIRSFTNDGLGLRPFTEYEYSITAVNSVGETSSNWTDVRTLEAAPRGLMAPVVSTVGSYTFFISWQSPLHENGRIIKYEVEYGEFSTFYSVLNVSTLYVSARTHNTSVSGVKPYTNYSVRVRAVNSAGSVVSRWTSFNTLQASPSDIGQMSVELVTGGRSVILSWRPPVQSNGLILNYIVYSADNGSNTPVYNGLNRLFELVHLQPYTKYSVQLKACTVAGCTRSLWQSFVTSQAPPTIERRPLIKFFNDSSVLIAWSRPEQTYGDVLAYQLLRRTVGRTATDYEIVFTVTDISQQSHFTYLDTTVQPFSRLCTSMIFCLLVYVTLHF